MCLPPTFTNLSFTALECMCVPGHHRWERLCPLSRPPVRCRLRTSCTTWCRTWTSAARTWRSGSRCWRPSLRRCWATCRPCRHSSARSSASSTGTSWRSSSSLTTNTAPSAPSRRPGGGPPPRPRPPPLRAARKGVGGDTTPTHAGRLLPSCGRVAFIS